MSGWLSQRLVERGIIKEEEQEIYQFGIRNGMIILLNVLTAFLIGLITEKLFIVAVFTVSFMVLRSYTGGYHSDRLDTGAYQSGIRTQASGHYSQVPWNS